MSADPQSPYVPVHSAAGMVEANLVRAVLEAAAVPVVLYAESAGTAYGLAVGSLGRVEVWVPRARRAEAEEILARMRTPSDEPDPPDVFDTPDELL